jgi:hypothetical protein
MTRKHRGDHRAPNEEPPPVEIGNSFPFGPQRIVETGLIVRRDDR